MSAITAPIDAVASLVGGNQRKKAIERAQREQRAASARASGRLDPYQESGLQANQLIQEGLDTGTLGGSFTPGDLTAEPGYQFQLEQGEQALERQQAARGNIYSGQAIKEAGRFGQGLAAQSYGDAYNRWLSTQKNRYNVLSGQQAQGSGVARRQGNIDLGLGKNMAQAALARQQAQARATAGAVGAAKGFGQDFSSAFTGGFSGGNAAPVSY